MAGARSSAGTTKNRREAERWIRAELSRRRDERFRRLMEEQWARERAAAAALEPAPAASETSQTPAIAIPGAAESLETCAEVSAIASTAETSDAAPTSRGQLQLKGIGNPLSFVHGAGPMMEAVSHTLDWAREIVVEAVLGNVPWSVVVAFLKLVLLPGGQSVDDYITKQEFDELRASLPSRRARVPSKATLARLTALSRALPTTATVRANDLVAELWTAREKAPRKASSPPPGISASAQAPPRPRTSASMPQAAKPQPPRPEPRKPQPPRPEPPRPRPAKASGARPSTAPDGATPPKITSRKTSGGRRS